MSYPDSWGAPPLPPAAQDDAYRAVLWRRLDAAGMDACRFRRGKTGWTIEGAAVFADRGAVARLSYTLDLDPDWSSLAARVSGWVGGETIDLDIRRTAEGGWQANGVEVPEVAGLCDVDLGFTPATNTNALRRMRLKSVDAAETTAVWLDAADWRFKPLSQTYRRLSETRYAYASPMHGYHAELEIDPFGVVLTYPDLWAADRVTAG